MATSERRASRRYEFRFPAVFRDGTRDVEGEVTSVGRHGVFVETETPRRPGELIQLYLKIPPLEGADSGNVRVMAVVAWALGVPEAQRTGRRPGMGLKFFMMAAGEKSRWDHFYLALQRRMESGQEQRRHIESTSGPVKFYVRPRDFLQLFRFQRHSLASGRYFLRSPFLEAVGKHVQVVLIHPESKEEFPLTGRVVGVQSRGPEVLRGMEIQWCNVVSTTHEDFRRFVLDGIHPIQEVDLRLAG